MSASPYGDAQRIVLRGGHWEVARHLALEFPPGAAPLHWLHQLGQAGLWPAAAAPNEAPTVQLSLGLTRRGLERAHVPCHVRQCFALHAPAYFAGAALRASRHLGAAGRDAPSGWAHTTAPADGAEQRPFAHNALDAVLSLHAMAHDEPELDKCLERARDAARVARLKTSELPPTRLLKTPQGETPVDGAVWVHFGYRDGLSHIGIEGWTAPERLAGLKSFSRHAAGEFLLGHPRSSGGNPWISGPSTRVWPQALRSFFRNGSFGVLQQIEQDVEAFERFVADSARATGACRGLIKAKLCGRHTDGRPLAAATASPHRDYDHANDRDGTACPFGAHARRMNPRDDALAQTARPRPLLRRGMPYGPAWSAADGSKSPPERGMVAQFFCASIEDQFEHLIGQWAERVPLGSQDGGGARDPLIGAHEPGDGAFEVPRGEGKLPIMLGGLQRFAHTVGTAYLFYPSVTTLRGIADSRLWRDRDPEDHW